MDGPVEKAPRVTLRVNILSLFLSLVLAAFAAVLLFLGVKNKEAVSELSQELMGFVRKETNHNLEDLFSSTEELVESFSSLYRSEEEITSDNEQMRIFMLTAVKIYPHLAYLYIGTEEGEIFTAGDLVLSSQKHFISRPKDPLPKEALYLWQTITLKDGGLYEISYYLDENFKVLVSEEYPQTQFDPRTRPWYKGALQTTGLYWSGVYDFFETNRPGVTVAKSLYNTQKKLFAVIGADLSFELLSEFFAKQTIVKNGKAFVLDEQGTIVIPEKDPQYFTTIAPEAVTQAFKTWKSEKLSQLELRWKGVTYLCNIEPFPRKNEEDWLVAILVPHSDFFSEIEATQRQALFMVLFVLTLSSLGVVFFAARISKPIVRLSREVDKVRQLDFSKEERVHSRIKEIFLMDVAISLLRSAVRSFTHYVPKEIVQELFSQGKEIQLGGEKREVSVFFSDIEGFTPIAEAQPTEALMAQLSEYFDGMSKIILSGQGTIDKYIGDSVMAFWGAPRSLADHSAACAQTALSCHAFVEEFNRRAAERGQPLFKTRFGINAGVAIIGNIGTPERMNYTLIGDMVNAASRLQGQNKVYGTSILIGEAVRKGLDERFVLRPIDRVEVKGKKEKIALFELVGMRGGPKEIAPSSEMLELCERFSRAYEALQEGNKSLARELFEGLHRDFPQDLPTKLYLERLQ